MSTEAGAGETVIESFEKLPEDEGYVARCHLCPKVKWAHSSWRALYELAFHYDRRHQGWTHE